MANKKDEYLRDPPDGGWGWLIVIGGMYCLSMWGGIIRCYSVFYSELMDEFDADYATVAWLNGMFQITYGLFTLLGPILMQKFQRRWLSLFSSIICCVSCFFASFMQQLWSVQILMGMIVGAGMGIISISMFTSTIRYFKKKIHMANQLLCLGVSVGPFIICPGYQYLVITFGWRGACQIVAGLFLNMAVSSALLRPIKLQKDIEPVDENICRKDESKLSGKSSENETLHPNFDDVRFMDIEILGSQSLGLYTPPINRKKYDSNRNILRHCEEKALSPSSKDWSDDVCLSDDTSGVEELPHSSKFIKKYHLSLFADKRFYLYSFSWTAFAAAFFSASTYIIPYGQFGLGLTEFEAATLVSAFAAGAIFSRIIYALLFDKMPERLRILYVCLLFATFSIAILVFSFIQSYVGAMICCVCIGALGGGADGIYSAFIPEIFSVNQYPFVFGYSNLITHSTGTATTILIGVAVDKLENLAVAFYIGFGFAILSSLLTFLLHKSVASRRKEKRVWDKEEQIAITRVR